MITTPLLTTIIILHIYLSIIIQMSLPTQTRSYLRLLSTLKTLSTTTHNNNHNLNLKRLTRRNYESWSSILHDNLPQPSPELSKPSNNKCSKPPPKPRLHPYPTPSHSSLQVLLNAYTRASGVSHSNSKIKLPLPLPIIKVLYKDDYLCVLSKPGEMSCVPSSRNPNNSDNDSNNGDDNRYDNSETDLTTLLHTVLYTTPLPSTPLHSPIPTISHLICHRLDYATSGIVVCSLSLDVQRLMHTLFRKNSQLYLNESDVNDERILIRPVVRKRYEALVHGHPTSTSTSTTGRDDENNNKDNEVYCINQPLIKDYKRMPYSRVYNDNAKNCIIDEISKREAVIRDLNVDEEYVMNDGVKEKVTRYISGLGYLRTLINQSVKVSITEFTVEDSFLLDVDDDGDGSNNNVKKKIPVTRVSLTPHTGRTHQLRVHLSEGLGVTYPSLIGNSDSDSDGNGKIGIVGDEGYGINGASYYSGAKRGDGGDGDGDGIGIRVKKGKGGDEGKGRGGLKLHAKYIGFVHPVTKVKMEVYDEVPF